MGVQIKGQYAGELRCILTHQTGEKIQTDAPLDNQGKGEAFSPTDLVAAALGSCMITIIAIRANAKNIAIGSPTFSIEKKMQSLPRKVQEIEIEICFTTRLTEKEKIYLEAEARRCPVALSLSTEVVQNIGFKYA